jgi:hypothetical protein
MTPSSSSAAATKRPYSAPRVTDAGSLRDLTLGGNPSNLSDSGSNHMRPP